MRFSFVFLALIAAAPPSRAESGTFAVHMILHAIGEERYEIVPSGSGLTLNTTFEYADRGTKRITTATLSMNADYTPVRLETKTAQSGFDASVVNGSATVHENGLTRVIPLAPLPSHYFTIFGSSPFAIQIAMMRYWRGHGRPARLPVLRAAEGADPIEIRPAGSTSIVVAGKPVALECYTVANLMFGHEILWLNQRGELAAAITFAGGLPMEAVRTEYEPALDELYRASVAQEMFELSRLGREVAPERAGTFAIAGAKLVDGTGSLPIEDSVVIVRDGRIAAAGPRGTTAIPRGMAVVDAKGKTLLPGLWEMHTHFSGVEFGPALLATGITTARDCGGEFEYLVAQRDAATEGAVSPRLVLAGLVDAGGLKAFGHVTAETPEEGRAVVDRYHAAGFEQIKLYTFLAPDVIRAIAAEAHRLRMTVTGHVPQVFNAFEGVEAGMDQINHLQYVSAVMREPGSGGTGSIALDVNSERSFKAVQFFRDHHTVIDPTAGWGEMANRSKEVDAASFEPGVDSAPFVLRSKFRAMSGNGSADQMRARLAQSVAVIGALHRAGVIVIPGSDTGLVGYGLDRELEIYVKAGMTPLEAIQSATIVSARAMKLDTDSGSVEVGKRADLILVDGNPLVNISDLRKVTRVVANGRLYDAGKLARSVGFSR